MNDAFPFCDEVILLREVILILDQSDHHLCDRRGAGKTRGFDTCRIEESRCIGNFFRFCAKDVEYCTDEEAFERDCEANGYEFLSNGEFFN